MHKQRVLIIIFLFYSPVYYCQATSSDIQLNNSALSFYKWYINAINSEKICSDFNIVPDVKGMCKLDASGYFKELKKLGTISDKFLISETERVKGCAEYMSRIKWKEYKNREDSSPYENDCPFLSFYYWIRSQEIPSGVELQTINLKDNSAEATLKIFTNDEKEKYYWPQLHPVVILEKENSIWKIVSININN